MTRQSLTRRARRRISREKGRKIDAVEMVLFGSSTAPTEEIKAEREKLCRRFRGIMADWNAQKPEVLWKWLREARTEYDADTDGLSFTMALHDDVMALREIEREEVTMQKRKAAQGGEFGYAIADGMRALCDGKCDRSCEERWLALCSRFEHADIDDDASLDCEACGGRNVVSYGTDWDFDVGTCRECGATRDLDGGEVIGLQ